MQGEQKRLRREKRRMVRAHLSGHCIVNMFKASAVILVPQLSMHAQQSSDPKPDLTMASVAWQDGTGAHHLTESRSCLCRAVTAQRRT